MKKILAAVVLAVSFAPGAVLAQERAGDAALGALSGAVVLGPVGAVAGAVVGYTAGPAIARSWGVRRSHHHERFAGRSATAASKQRALQQRAPAQGTAPQGATTQGAAAQTAAGEISAPPAKASAPPAAAGNARPALVNE